ncbi:MAG: hypothetical protein GY861_15670 [bacterium]|nr:hypothetical protein [bacterium]
MMAEEYERVVDRSMHDYGDCDFDKKRIRVNPRLGGLLNTIIHEELHAKYPDKSEKWIKDKSKKHEASLTIKDAQRLLKKYIFDKKKGSKSGRPKRRN